MNNAKELLTIIISVIIGLLTGLAIGYVAGRYSKRGSYGSSESVGDNLRRTADINRELTERERGTSERLRRQADTINAIDGNNRKIKDLIGRAKEILDEDDDNQ